MDRELAVLGIELKLDICAGRQFTNHVKQRSRRSGHRTIRIDFRIRMINRFNIEVGCRELHCTVFRIDQDIGQDRNGVTAFNDILDMSERI